MQNPIPFDWDGESWRRFCVCWPDSPQWLALLRGFITYPTRGRSWDGRTGSIIDVQAIGKQIAEDNLPLEEVLLSCSEGDKIARSILFLAAVVGGFNIDNISEGVPSNFFDSVEFDTLGLANRIGPQTIHTGDTTIQATLDRLEGIIGGVQATNDNVAKAISMLTIAMTGQTIDFSAFDPAEFFTVANLDFTQNGLANRIGPQLAHNSTSSLSARMDQVREAIENLAINVNVESGTIELPGGEALNDIVTQLEEISTVIETRSVAETEAQNTNFSDLVTAVQELQLQCETIVNTTQLHQTIAGATCGTGGAGTYPAPPSTQTTTPEDEEGDPPPGFESWGEYDQYKCDMANLILDQMISDIATTGLLAGAAAAISTLGPLLVAALLTPIGWAEIIIIGTLFITLLAAGVSTASLTSLLETNKNEFVCALLNGTSVSGSISGFSDLCDSKVESDSTLGALPSFLRSQVSAAIKAYATVDSINRLYEKTAVPPPGGNDCSDCDEESDYRPWFDGSIDRAYEVSTHPSNPCVFQGINYIPGSPCGANRWDVMVEFLSPVTITSIEIDDYNGQCGGEYHIFNYFGSLDLADPIYSNNVAPQTDGERSGVQTLWVFMNADTVPTVTISYTVD